MTSRALGGSAAAHPLLERDEEVGVLVDAVAGAVEGRGAVVLVRAAAGLGKTRLLDLAAGLAEGAGMQLLRARGSSLERDFPFGLALGLLEAPVRALPSAERDEVLQGSAALAAPMLLGVQPVEQALVALQEHSLVHALQWVVVGLGERRPLALIVDDLHWADAPSLRFLAYLAARVHDLPVLVVAAKRPREPGAENELLAQLAAAASVRALAPAPLSDSATASLVRDAGPAARPSQPFVDACFEVTGGNPLLLIELLRALAAEGAGGQEADVARVREIGPEPVARSVRSTLARLGEAETRLARAVAILGDEADPRTAGRLAGLDPAEAATAEAQLEEAGLLDGGCFAHPLLRRAVYDDTAAAARSDLHRRAAALLSEETSRGSAAAAHLLLAPGAGEAWAVDVLREAAEAAAKRAGHVATLRFLRRALAEPPPVDARIDLLAHVAFAAARAGDQDAPVALAEAIEAAPAGRPRAQLYLALAKAHYQQGDMPGSVTAADSGIAEPETDAALDCELDAAWAAAAMWTGAGRDAIEQRLAAVASDSSAGPGLGRRDLLAGLAGMELVKGEDRERTLRLARDAWGEGAYLREGTCDSPALGAMVSALLRGGALTEALDVLDQLIADARRRGSPLAYATWRNARGTCLLHLGRLAEAESDLEETLDARAIGWDATVPLAIESLATVLLEQDRLAAAEGVLADLGDAEAKFGGGPLWGVIHAARGRLALARDRPAEALEEFRATGRLVRDVLGTTNPAVSPWRSEAALALRLLGETEEAAALVADEVAHARRFGAPRALAFALRVQAIVKGGEEGAALALEAAEIAAAGGAALEAARARVVHGTLLRAAGKRIEAQASLHSGLEGAVACGAHALAERARKELKVAGSRPRRASRSGPEALTAGERRVAMLAADGFTSRQIAEALFVTPRAVGFHLSNAYRKLGIAGRGELATALGHDAATAAARRP